MANVRWGTAKTWELWMKEQTQGMHPTDKKREYENKWAQAKIVSISDGNQPMLYWLES